MKHPLNSQTCLPRRLFRSAPLLASALLLATPGCRDAAMATSPVADDHAGHGHDHAEAAVARDDHAGHHHAEDAPAEDDHAGHDHGGGESADDHADEIRLSAESIAQFGIEVTPAEVRVLEEMTTAPARIGFNTEAMSHITSLVTGRVAEIPVKLGDVVDAGDPLLRIESPELGRLQGELLAADAAAAAALPAVELARDGYERAQRLFDTAGGITLNQVQERESALRAAERELTAADSEAAAAENALRLLGMDDDALQALRETCRVDPMHTVLAPLAGTVVERAITPGEAVEPGDNRLLVVADLSTVWVHADVAESRLNRLGVGASAELTVPALGGRSFTGTVTYVDPRVDPRTRTARLRIEVDNADAGGELRPGMFADARLRPAEAERDAGVLSVTEAAVHTTEGEPSVFVPVPGEARTFARRGIRVGRAVGGYVPVLDGLEPGDAVVTRGSFLLKADLGKAGAAHEH